MTKRHADRPRNGFFTTWSLKHPFDQCVEDVGGQRVAVWANAQELPVEVMSRIRRDYHQSNSLDIRPVLQSTVLDAEKRAIPLACLILGKG